MLVLLLICIFYGLLWSIISLSKHPYICNTFMCHLTSVITDIYMSNFKCQTTQQIYGHMGVYGKVLTPDWPQFHLKWQLKWQIKLSKKGPLLLVHTFHSCIPALIFIVFLCNLVYHLYIIFKLRQGASIPHSVCLSVCLSFRGKILDHLHGS